MLSQLYRRKKKDSNVLVKVMQKERLNSELQDTLKTQLARLEKDLTLKNVEEEVSMYGRGARSRVVRFAEEPVFIGAEELVPSHHYPEASGGGGEAGDQGGAYRGSGGTTKHIIPT